MRHRTILSAAVGGIGLALLAAAMLASSAVSASSQASHTVRSLRGGTLRVNFSGGGFDSVDPGHAYSWPSWSLLYTTELMLLNHRERNGQAGAWLYPEAAAAFPAVSRNGKTYTFRIRQGLRFSDGSPVTAACYRRAWERSLSPKMTTDPAASPPVAVNDRLQKVVVGGQAFAAGKTEHIAGITARGRTLVFRLTHPDGAFLSYLAMLWFGAVEPKTPYSTTGLTVYPSAGPYYIQSYDGQSSLVEARNPYYRGPRPAYPDRIVWTLDTDQTRSLLQVEAGQADVDAVGPPTSSYASLGKKYGVNKKRFFVGSTFALYYFVLNTSRAPFSKAKYRRAFNWAIDRGPLAAVFGRYGATPTDQLLVPGIPGYQRLDLYPTKRANPAKARKVAGGTIPGTVVVIHDTNPIQVAAAQIAEYDLQQMGVRTKDEPVDNYYEVLAQKGGDWDVAFSGWSTDFVDPSGLINALVDDRAAIADQGRFKSPALDRQLDRAATLFGTARNKAYAALDREIMSNYAPYAPWARGNSVFLVSARVHHWVYSTYFAEPDWNALAVR